MKKILLTIILVSMIINLPIASAKNQTIKKYDVHGNYQGKLVTEGNRTKIYKKNGDYNGYLRQDGNKVKRYAKNGDFEEVYKHSSY